MLGYISKDYRRETPVGGGGGRKERAWIKKIFFSKKKKILLDRTIKELLFVLLEWVFNIVAFSKLEIKVYEVKILNWKGARRDFGSSQAIEYLL